MASVTVRTCESCGRGLSPLFRPNRKLCSASCRQAAYETRGREASDRDIAVTPPALLAELEEALGKATEEVRLVAQVAAAAGKGQWRASAWLLERRYPERWAPRPRSAPEPEPEPVEDDPFREVDDLAARRRAKHSGRPRS